MPTTEHGQGDDADQRAGRAGKDERTAAALGAEGAELLAPPPGREAEPAGQAEHRDDDAGPGEVTGQRDDDHVERDELRGHDHDAAPAQVGGVRVQRHHFCRRRRSRRRRWRRPTPGAGGAARTTAGRVGPAQRPGPGPAHADGRQAGRGDRGRRHGQAGEGRRRGREAVRSAGLGRQPAVELTGQVDHGARRLLETTVTGLDEHDGAEPPAAQRGPGLTVLVPRPQERVDVGDVLGAV